MSMEQSDFIPSTRFGPFTGKRFLTLMLAAFAIVFAVNGLLIYKALSTFDGIEVDDAYQRGRLYNQTLDAMAAQIKLGWHASVDVSAPKASQVPHAAHVVVAMTDKTGKPVDGLKLNATFWHPVSVGIDQTVSMKETAPGRYEGDFRLALGGNWLLRLAGIDGKGEKFAAEQRVMIRN